MGLDIVNSPWCAMSVRAPHGHIRRRAGFLQILGPARSRRKWKPWRFPCGARRGIARGLCGFLRMIRWNHKCTAVSNRSGPVAWCDHENSTGVKFLRALHSALRARNRMGAKSYGARGWMWLRHYPCWEQIKHQRFVLPLGLVRGSHRWPMDSLHKGPVMWKPIRRHDIFVRRNFRWYLFFLTNFDKNH